MAQHTHRAFRNSTYIKRIYYMARDTMTIQVPMTTKTLHNIYFNNYWLTATLGMQHSHTTVQQLHNTIFHNYWLPWCIHELHGFWRNISSYNHMLTSTYYKLNTHLLRHDGPCLYKQQTIFITQTCSLRNC